MVLYTLNAVLFITETKIRRNSIPSVFCLKSRAFQELSAEHLTRNVWKSEIRVEWQLFSKTVFSLLGQRHWLITFFFSNTVLVSSLPGALDIAVKTSPKEPWPTLSLTTSLLKSNCGMLIVSVLLGRSCGSLNLWKFAIATSSHEFLFFSRSNQPHDCFL